MSDIGIKQNQVVLPNEKNKLIEALQKEYEQLKRDIDEKKISGAALELAIRHRDMLQNLINKFLDKKGVITPDETNEALSTLDESKKLRLGKDFKLAISRGTFNIIALVLLGIGVFYYIKKRKQ